MVEAEWPVKLQMRDRPACNDYVRNIWMERLAAEPTDDRQAVLQQLRTRVRRLKRMVLPQARPTCFAFTSRMDSVVYWP